MGHPVLVLTRAVFTVLADVLAPPSCAACDARLRGRAVFCAACASGVVPAAWSDPARSRAERAGRASGALAFAIYGGAVAIALRRLKYGGRPDLGAPLGHLVRRAARDARLAVDRVVPVPLHPRRLADRGYNQAALLAAELARELDAPMHATCLERVRNTPQQARLDRGARLCNVAGAFRARPNARVRGARIALVDDVASTGATLAACASALLAAGAARVTPIVVARAEGDADR